MRLTPTLALIGLNDADWFFVGLASAIIFAILGRKLWRDIRGWMGTQSDP